MEAIFQNEPHFSALLTCKYYEKEKTGFLSLPQCLALNLSIILIASNNQLERK